MEDVESNPGLSYGGAYGIKWIVEGTFPQENTWFGETAGIQCTCNAYYAIIISAITKHLTLESNWIQLHTR